MHFPYSLHHSSMKTFFTFLVMTFIAVLPVAAQKTPVVKMYAFIQHVLPGAKKNIIVDESGKTIEPATSQKMNYYFYAEKKKSEVIKITGIWMYGEKYNAQVDKGIPAPVELFESISSNQSGKTVLTPAEGNEFLQVLPLSIISKNKKIPSYLKKLIRQNELVLIYLWKGKTWYLPVKKIKSLQPVASV